MPPSLKKYQIHFFLLIAILLLAGIAFSTGGWELVTSGVMTGFSTLLRELPLLAAAFLTAGFIQSLIEKDTISQWLGREAGIKGIILACLGGGLIPGGPYVYYPIAGALLSSGAGLGVLVAFVTAKNLWSVSRLPYELAKLGPMITIRRYLITFLIPPLLGLLVEWLFGPMIQKIREEVKS